MGKRRVPGFAAFMGEICAAEVTAGQEDHSGAAPTGANAPPPGLERVQPPSGAGAVWVTVAGLP